MPDSDTDYVDQNGQKVPVVSDDMYTTYHSGALGSGIEKQVKDQLDKVNAAGYQISPDSPYADMLRKNILYQNLKGEADSRYKFSTPEDKSNAMKTAAQKEAFSEKMRSANLDNSNKRLGIAQTLLSMKQDKAAQGTTGGTFTPDDFLGTVNDTYGTDAQVQDNPGKPAVTHLFSANEPAIEPTYRNTRIIPVTADPKDLNIVAGKPDAAGNRPIEPKTFILKDGTKVKGYEYDPETGNATGDEGVQINKTSVQREFLNHMKKGVLQQVEKPKTVIQKVADKVKSFANKIKGTDKPLY
jgi:hypothetical protein